MANNNSTTGKVVTEVVRFSYVHVFAPHATNEGDEPKYSVSLIVPKTDTITVNKVNRAIEWAKEQGKSSKFSGKIPANLKQPLRDGDVDRPDDEAYANCYFINANAYKRPGLVDKKGNHIIDEEEIYSGCYGRASITFYPYNANGSKGIACGLNNLMKTKDGEYLGGRASAENDFADYIEGEDDLL